MFLCVLGTLLLSTCDYSHAGGCAVGSFDSLLGSSIKGDGSRASTFLGKGLVVLLRHRRLCWSLRGAHRASHRDSGRQVGVSVPPCLPHLPPPQLGTMRPVGTPTGVCRPPLLPASVSEVGMVSFWSHVSSTVLLSKMVGAGRRARPQLPGAWGSPCFGERRAPGQAWDGGPHPGYPHRELPPLRSSSPASAFLQGTREGPSSGQRGCFLMCEEDPRSCHWASLCSG